MRKYFFLSLYLISCSIVNAQDNFKNEASWVVGFIERKLDASDVRTTGVPLEFFVYDFTLDSSGTITSFSLLLLDSLTGLAHDRSLGELVKLNFKFPKSKYKKLLVPVIVVHSGNDEGTTPKDMAILETIRFFEILSKKGIDDVFVTQYAEVVQME